MTEPSDSPPVPDHIPDSMMGDFRVPDGIPISVYMQDLFKTLPQDIREAVEEGDMSFFLTLADLMEMNSKLLTKMWRLTEQVHELTKAHLQSHGIDIGDGSND